MKKAILSSCLFPFVLVTLAFIVSRFVLFQGFHGTDDLHYAMLSARMLKGSYDPFQPADIFSGRIVLIAWQALLYRTGGVNLFTTCIGTVIATVAACFITVSRLLPVRNRSTVLVASSLFYFSPSLAMDITGIEPDPYVMLTGTCIVLLLKKGIREDPSRKIFFILIGVLIAATLLIKETVLVFLPYAIFVTLFYQKRWVNLLWILGSFAGIILLMGWGYYHFTGNAFFKFSQIENSAYPNPCNFSYLPANDLVIRLTYGVWRTFILLGFYPFVLGGISLLLAILTKKNLQWQKDYELTGFSILLLLSLYFPFSWSGYQPLCAAPRHFYFILPLAVVIISTTLYRQREAKKSSLVFALLVLFALLVCIQGTGNKWQWMIYLLIFLYLLTQPFLARMAGRYHYLVLSAILFLSILEPLFFRRAQWFKNLQELNGLLHAQYYYFPDHDNMMHWKLLHKYDDRLLNAYNFEKHPYKVYQVYYEKPDSTRFHPGWLIVNRVYTTCSPVFINKVDSLQHTGFFSKSVIRGGVGAYWMERKEQYQYIQENNFRR
ncbi:MAG: hypothetical protein INR73_24800 [Williamsia sp.]|nr:hypothetical protein [Williamsia sp.]